MMSKVIIEGIFMLQFDVYYRKIWAIYYKNKIFLDSSYLYYEMAIYMRCEVRCIICQMRTHSIIKKLKSTRLILFIMFF
jgi:hypothetical protein